MRNTFLFIILFAVILSPIIGHSQQPGWQWLNPKPEGNGVTSIYFTSDMTGYAATCSNAVMKTTDGGISWELKYIPAEIYLQEVQFLNPQTGYISTTSNKLVKTTNAGMNWEVIEALRPDVKFRDIYFLNENTVYCTYDSLYRNGFAGITHDGGITWAEIWKDTVLNNSSIKITLSNSDLYLFSTRFIDSFNHNARIQKSSNNGANWNLICEFPYMNFRSAQFTSSSIVYANLYNNSGVNKFYKSINGGNNWSQINSFNNFQALDDDNLVSVDFSYNKLYKSSNGGNNWLTYTLPNQPYVGFGNTNDYSNYFFININTGIVMGANYIRTVNGGVNWINTTDNIIAHFWGMDFINANTGFLSGANNNVYKTTDGGNNWDINFTHSNSIEDIQFINNQTGFMGSSYNGNIARTTNCGVTWDTFSTNRYAITGIDFIDDNTGYITAKYGPVGKTTNGGENWKNITNIYYQSWDIDFINANTGLVCSGGAFKRTSDGGVNWDSITIPWDTYVYKIKFIDEKEVLAGTLGSAYQNHFILKSTNGGVDWFIVYTADQGIGEIEVEGNVAYAVGYSSGKLFKSTDRGNTWRAYNTISNSHHTRIKFVNQNTGYICGSGGMLIKTTNGGFDPIGIEPTSAEVPTGFTLHQNYPNPFNPSTKIKFDIPKSSLVRLTVYDILGRQVAELVNQHLNAGTFEYEWSATGEGAELSSGIYFYKLEAGDFVETKRMVLIK